MLSSDVLTILRCPEDRSELALADSKVVQRINDAIAKRQLVNRGGRTVEQSIDGGLIRADSAWLYPIVDRIPVLVQDDAISMGAFNQQS